MKKTLIATVALLAVALAGNANDITKSDAKRIALQFMAQHNNAISKAKANGNAGQMTVTAINGNAIGGNQPIAYACSYANDGGFVLVAGDDCVSPILGYSDSGNIDLGNMPDNMKGWLEGVSAEIEAIKNGRGVAVKRSVSATDAVVVVDSLITTLWNQREPYNNLCPKSYPTGCVATAMAQIMNYHRWPEKSTGQSYCWYATDSTTWATLSVEFNSVYDWDNMLTTYEKSNWTDEQANAVALLMRDCGAAACMSYSKDASGAGAMDAAYGASHNFDYITKMYFHDSYSTAKFEELIKTELDNLHPVYFSGFVSSKKSGGHAFVVDGYRTDGMYHVNWGWGGLNNGYFNLCLMDANPIKEYAFPVFQGIITFAPNREHTNEPFYNAYIMLDYDHGGLQCGLSLDSDFEGDKSSAFNVKLENLYNMSNHFSFLAKDTRIGIGLYNANDSLMKEYWIEDSLITQSWPNAVASFEEGTFSNLPDGNYSLQAICKEDQGEGFLPIQKIIVVGKRDRINMAISGSTMKVSDIKVGTPTIVLADSIVMPQKVTIYTSDTCKVALENISDVAVECQANVEIKASLNDTTSQYLKALNFVMYDRKKAEVNIPLYLTRSSFTEGEYIARVNVLNADGDTIKLKGLGEWMPLTVIDDETKVPTVKVDSVTVGEYDLSDTKTTTLDPQALEINKSSADSNVKIMVYYKFVDNIWDYMQLRIGDLGNADLTIKKSSLEIAVNRAECPLSIGEYDLPIEYQDPVTGEWKQVEGSPSSIHVKVIDSTTGIDGVENGNASGNAKVYDINGSPASSTSRGLKIIVEPTTGNTKKIIVK